MQKLQRNHFEIYESDQRRAEGAHVTSIFIHLDPLNHNISRVDLSLQSLADRSNCLRTDSDLDLSYKLPF